MLGVLSLEEADLQPWELHPSLVHFPIAFFLGAVLYDLYAWRRVDPAAARVATGLLWAGVGTAALAAAAGLLAYFTGPASYTEEAGRLIWWHIGAAVAQFVLFTVVAVVRWRVGPGAPPTWSRVVGLLAAAVLVFAGYLGGYIVYHGASGIEPDLLAPRLHQKQLDKERKEASRGPSPSAAAMARAPSTR